MTTVETNRMDELQWPRIVNKVVTQKWSQLKNTLVMKDFVDYLIEKRVVTLEYWMGLKSKPITESERTEDFLSLAIKFDRAKYNYFLEALLNINRNDLVKDLVKAQTIKPKRFKASQFKDKKVIRKPDKDQFPDSPNPDIHERVNDAGQARTQNRGTDDTVKEAGVVDVDKGTEPLAQANVKDTTSQHGKADVHKTATRLQEAKEDTKEPTGKIPAKGQSNGKKFDDRQQALSHQLLMSEKLHHGIGPDDRYTTKKTHVHFQGKDVSQHDGLEHDTEDDERMEKTSPGGLGTRSDTITAERTGTSDKSLDKIGSEKSKEELLEMREKLVQSKETELKKKEDTLIELEKSLKQRETELLSRENTLVTNNTKVSELGPLPIPRHLQMLQREGSSVTPTASTTQSSDIFADVREQLALMKNNMEIESEHTTTCYTPKEDYVKVEELQAVRNDIEELKQEIVTDRSTRETFHQKMEDMKHEIDELNLTIRNLEREKESMQVEQTREINKLKSNLKNMVLNHNEGINSLKMVMKSKESECASLTQTVNAVKKNAGELEKRVKKLEDERNWFESEMQRYEKEVSTLKVQLDKKESEIIELRKTLEDTESEKEDLAEELADLKRELANLKAEKKRLEQEKKTLLSRCVKPMWNQTSRRTPFQK